MHTRTRRETNDMEMTLRKTGGGGGKITNRKEQGLLRFLFVFCPRTLKLRRTRIVTTITDTIIIILRYNALHNIIISLFRFAAADALREDGRNSRSTLCVLGEMKRRRVYINFLGRFSIAGGGGSAENRARNLKPHPPPPPRILFVSI